MLSRAPRCGLKLSIKELKKREKAELTPFFEQIKNSVFLVEAKD
jgi:hypothetical protein